MSARLVGCASTAVDIPNNADSSYSDTLNMKRIEDALRRFTLDSQREADTSAHTLDATGAKAMSTPSVGMDSGEGSNSLAIVPGQQDASSQGMELADADADADADAMDQTSDSDPMLFPYSKLLDLAQQEAERLGGAKSWDASDQFYSLPCDFQIAIVTYYTLRFAKKEEFTGVDSFGFQMDDEGFTQESFDRWRSNFLNKSRMEYVLTFSPPKHAMYPEDFENPFVKDIYPTLVTRYGTNSIMFDLKLMYSVFAKRRSELESKCMRLGLSCLQTDDERFVMNPMQFHFNPELDTDPQIYQLYHFLPGWALIAHELGFFWKTIAGGSNPAVEQDLETVGYPNDDTYTRSKSKLELDFKQAFAESDPGFSYTFDTSKKFYENVDDILNLVNRLFSFNPNSDVLATWIQLIKQYKSEGEVDYSTYNFLARYAMQNGFYQHTSGNRPMWKFFYGVKPIGPVCCVLDSQKFDFQVLDKVDMILGDFAYGGKVDTLALSRLSDRIKRTAATMLAVEQDLYLTWNSNVDGWLSKMIPAPKWFANAAKSLSNLMYVFDNGRLVGVHSSKQDKDLELGGISALSPAIVGINKSLYPEYDPDDPPQWRMDFIWVETKYYSIFQLQTAQNLNYNYRIRLAEVVGPASRIEALKYIAYKSEPGRCLVAVEDKTSEIMQELPLNGYGKSKHRNPIGLSTYSNYDSIYGHRKTSYFNDLMPILTPDVADPKARRRRLYDIVNQNLIGLKTYSIQHPKYGFPDEVNNVRLTYKIVRQGTSDKDKFHRGSGYMEGDSIKCIIVNPIRQCEDACAYYAIKMRKKYIDIVLAHHKFIATEVLPACMEFWQYLRRTRQTLGATATYTQQGLQIAVQTVIQLQGSQEYQRFQDFNDQFGTYNFDMVNFWPVEYIQSNQTFKLIKEPLRDALQNLSATFSSPNEVMGAFSRVEDELFNEMMKSAGFTSKRVKQMITTYDMALVDDIDLYVAQAFNSIVDTMSASLPTSERKTTIEKFKYTNADPTRALSNNPFINVKKGDGTMLNEVKQFPNNRSVYNDLYHHLCVGDEYTGDALCSAVFDITLPVTCITMEEVENQAKAFDKYHNYSSHNGAIEAFLERKYKFHTDNPSTSSPELRAHIARNKKKIKDPRESRDRRLPFLLGILNEYNHLLAEKERNERNATMTDQEFGALKSQIERQGIEERRMGYIPRRSPQGTDTSVYPCWETLNAMLQTMSYVDLGVVKTTLKPFDDVYDAAVNAIEDLKSFKDSKSQFALWDLLIAWENVENAIEAVFIHTTTQRVVETSKSNTSQKDGERSAEVRARGVEVFTTRQSAGPSTNIMDKYDEIVNSPSTSFSDSELKDLGIGIVKSGANTFKEDYSNISFLGMYFAIVNPIQEDGESELKTAMRRSDGRAWKIKDGQSTWFNNYEMLLMYSLQVLGNVFRYGGYKSVNSRTEFLTWRYPNYSSDIDPTVDHPRSNYFHKNYGSMHEENRFYPGILDDSRPDERSWAERMLGDKFQPPRWNTRSLNGKNFVDSSDGDPYNEQTDFYRYMVSDSDSVLETFCSIADSWLSLFNPNIDAEDEDEDAVLRRIDEHFATFELTDNLVVEGRFDKLVKFHQHVDNLDGVLYELINAYDPTKKEIDILETEEEFVMDSFDRYADEMGWENGYENKEVTQEAYSNLFMQPSSKDLEEFKSSWKMAIQESQITLRNYLGYNDAFEKDEAYGTNGRGGPRWGGTYLFEGQQPAPDLQAALDYLRTTQNGSGYEMLNCLEKMASDDALKHIELVQKRFDANYGDSSTSSPDQSQELDRLQSELDQSEARRRKTDSLYNVVRHAIMLKDLDIRLFADESDKRTAKLMTEVSTQISNAIYQLAVEKNGTVETDFERLVQITLANGISDAINNIVGMRSYNLAKQKTQQFFYRAKSQKMKQKVDEVVQSMNALFAKNKVSFKTNTILHMMLAMKRGQFKVLSMKDVFEQAEQKEIFDKLFQREVEANYKTNKARVETGEKLKRKLLLLFDLYSVGGFPQKTEDGFPSQDFYESFKVEFPLIQDNTWNGLYIGSQKQQRSTGISTTTRRSDRKVNAQLAAQNKAIRSLQAGRGSKRSRRDDMNVFVNPLSTSVPNDQLRQSMQELARDVRLLAVGFQDPYFPNDEAKANFLTRIGAKKSDYENTLRDLKIKYPGINDIRRNNAQSFASLQRFASEFYKILKQILEIEGNEDYAVNRGLYEVTERMMQAPNFHYKKDDNQAAMMVANDDGLVNAFENALRGEVAFQLLEPSGFSFRWWYLDLAKLHSKPNTLMHYNKLRILALDTMSALSREFQLFTSADTIPSSSNDPGAALPSYISLVETLNARKLQFEERACYMIKQVAQQITLQVGSPGLIKSEVEEFMRSSFIESSELSNMFALVFEELCDDLQTVVDFESRWDAANEHLHVLRIEDLYKRLSSGSASSNYDTPDAGSLLDTTTYDTSIGVVGENESEDLHVKFKCNNGSKAYICGIDLRVSTDTDEWKVLYKRYELNESQIQIENQQRLQFVEQFGPMVNIMHPWQKLAPPTIEQVKAAMTALQTEAGGRNPKVQSKRPSIRLVDRIEHNFYAHFVDVLCLAHRLAHQQPERYKDMLKNAYEVKNLPNVDPETEEDSDIYRRGLKLRRIYNPDGVNSTPDNPSTNANSDIDLFYEQSRFITSGLKYSQVTVQAVNEIIRNYSLVRQLSFPKEDVDPEIGNFSIFETDAALMSQWQRVETRPMNERDFNAYVQDFKHRADKGLSALGISKEQLENPDYKNLKEMFDKLHNGNSENGYLSYYEVMQNASRLARALAIPLYPRPNKRRFANEQTYSETLSASRRNWLTVTASTIEKSNPKNLYDSAFVARLGFDEPQMDVEPEIEVELPKDDFANLDKVRFKNDVDNMHLVRSEDTFQRSKRGRPGHGFSGFSGLAKGRNVSGESNDQQRLEQIDAQTTLNAYNDWLFIDKSDAPNTLQLRTIDESPRKVPWVSACPTVTDGNCFYHSILINMGSIFRDNQDYQDFLRRYFSPTSRDESIRLLKNDIMQVFCRAIADCEHYLETQPQLVPMQDGFLFNPNEQPSVQNQETYSRWACCNLIYRLSNDDLIRLMLFTQDGAFADDYKTYQRQKSSLNLPDITEQTSFIGIMNALYAYFSSDFVFSNDLIIQVAAHVLRTPIVVYDKKRLDGVPYNGSWQYAPGVTAGSEYAQPNAPCFMLFHPENHFEAIYPRHLETFVSEASRATYPMYQGNNVQPYVQQATAQAMVAAPEAPIFINVFDKKTAELSE